jgi:hypothetical protein
MMRVWLWFDLQQATEIIQIYFEKDSIYHFVIQYERHFKNACKKISTLFIMFLYLSQLLWRFINRDDANISNIQQSS